MKTRNSRKTTQKQREDSTLTFAPETIMLDFPQDDEQVCGTRYTLRVDAPGAAQAVEVSIDHGPWTACRRASGYWWYDWAGFDSGPHQARAKMRNAEGRVMTTLARHFRVGN
ncbi:MAG: hypothetical protein HY924_13255 [Elusimicrobia bacterium]|nr:hypothetical protein [Elusimicrobiota bacterium]